MAVRRSPHPGNTQHVLLRALNAAAASLQRSTRCEADVFRAFSEGMSSLDLYGFICLFDDDSTHLVVRAASQPNEMIARIKKRTELQAEGLKFLPEVASHLQTVANRQQSLFVSDCQLIFQSVVPVRTRRMLQRLALFAGPVPAILSPIVTEGEQQGILCILGDRLAAEDVTVVEAFANHTSIALDHARLVSRLQEGERTFRGMENSLRRRAQELTMLHSISLDVSASLELPTLLKTIVERSTDLLTAGGGCLYLCGPHEDEVTCVVSYQTPMDYTGRILKYGQGAAGIVAQTGTPLNVEDYLSWPQKVFYDEEAQIVTSVLTVPMLSSGEVTGVLQLMNINNSRSFTQEDQDLLALFADQAAIAIENARLIEAQERRAATLEAVRQASLSLTSSLDLHQVLEAILGSALSLLPGAQNGHIFLYYSEKDQLVFGSAKWADGRGGQPIAQPRSDGLTYTVARSGETVVVRDMLDHPLYANIPPEAGWNGSIVGLPLKIAQRVVGVMNISYSMPNGFGADDLRVIRLLGDQAAIAIENARLYERAALERRHLRVLYDLSRDLATSLNANAILEKALHLTCQALGAVNGEAFLYLPKEDRLSLRASIKYDARQIAELDQLLCLSSERGLSGRVVKTRQPIYVPDISLSPDWIWIPGLDDPVQSVLIAPILDEDRVLGVLSVMHSSGNAFSADHLDLLVAICRQVALAMTNAENYQQVQSLVELLEAERQQLISLIERLPVGVLLLDRDYRLMVTNPLGRDILRVLSPDSAEEPILSLGDVPIEALIAYQENSLPLEIHWQGTPARLFEAQARLIGAEEHRLVITIREVTRERENQARIQMQERLATVGQLAAGIAHDFNNIMAAIMVYNDLLMRDLRAFPASRERLGVIQQQVQRASSLIRQILDFSRRSVIEYSNLDLLPFLKELYKLLRRVIPETIRLELVSQPGVYLIQADPTRLQQIFMNLTLNACDAMPLGGEIRFRMDHFNLQEEDPLPFSLLVPGEWVRIVIADTGTGIAPENLPHIFEPFFTTKPVGQGTGLGLAQVYGIVKQHNGFIDVSSQVGKGTTFTIYLPGLEQPPGKEETPYEETPEFDGGGATAMLVEDDQATREALRILLESHNYHVVVASQGKEALDLFRNMNGQISLVVSDMVMPEMGGADLYRALEDCNPGVRVLFITGHPIEQDMHRILTDGKLHWLMKPFSIRDFMKAVEELLSMP